jgi:YggT family protein
MGALVSVLLIILDVYSWIIIAGAVVSWLIAFEVINVKNEQAQNLVNLLSRLTEPVYKPLRKYIPPLGGVDVTPIVVLFLIFLIELIIKRLLLPHGVYY